MPDVLDAITSQMPEPNEAAIAAEEERAAQEQGEFDTLRDRFGRPFDPQIHMTGADGAPRTTALGKLRVRAGHSPASSTKTPPGNSPESVSGEDADFKLAAEVTVHSIVSICVSLGGDDFAPTPAKDSIPGESEQMVAAWERYYRTKGISEISPGVLVAITTGGYVMTRVNKESVRTRIKERFGFGGLRGFWSRLRRKPAPETANGA